MGMVKVLVGGCFYLLHKGHIVFLKKAKEAGEKLIVLLESDERIKKLKGKERPVQTQSIRAQALKNLGFVDEVISLPNMESDKDYDDLIRKIKPDIISVTEGYPGINHHKRTAELVGAELKVVSKLIRNYSTTRQVSKKVVQQ